MSDWYPPSRPLPVDGGIRAQSRRGEIGRQWWSARFIRGLDSLAVGGRLARGRRYARAGQVMELSVDAGAVVALVQGSRPRPYRVRIGVPAFGKADWAKVETALAGDAWFTAKLLNGDMPTDIEAVFDAAGLRLFPDGAADLAMDCSCPDREVPCKHVAAALYLLAERFDDDPFAVLLLRGRSREDLLGNLAARRGASPTAPGGRRAAGAAPALADLLDSFYEASVASAPPRPTPVPIDSLLDQVPQGAVTVRGRDLVDLLRPMYQALGSGSGDESDAEAASDRRST